MRTIDVHETRLWAVTPDGKPPNTTNNVEYCDTLPDAIDQLVILHGNGHEAASLWSARMIDVHQITNWRHADVNLQPVT